MAIFVLVIIVLVIQVRPEGVPKDEFAKALAQLEQEQQENESQAEKIKQLEKALDNAVATAALELVVIVDGSGSMETPLLELKNSIRTIAEAIPLVAPEFRLGLIIYREELDLFPVRRILPRSEDGGASLDAVVEFTENMNPTPSLAYLDEAMKKALSMYNKDSSRKSLMILGDIGPFEYMTGEQAFIECPQSEKEQRLISAIERFAVASEYFRVFSLYSKSDNQKNCQMETERFFENIASTLGPKGFYSDDISKILVFLLQGVLGGEE